MESTNANVQLDIDRNNEAKDFCGEHNFRDYEVPTIGFRDAVLAKKFGTSPYDSDR